MLCLVNGQLMKYSLVKSAHGRGKHRTAERSLAFEGSG